MAEQHIITDEKLDAIAHDLGDAAELIEGIQKNLEERGSDYDERDAVARLAAQRIGQLLDSIQRALGGGGFRDLDSWLPRPKSFPQA